MIRASACFGLALACIVGVSVIEGVRPRLQLVAGADAPAPPASPYFLRLPDRDEVIDAIQRDTAGWTASATRIELLGESGGEVRWQRVDPHADVWDWVYQPRARVVRPSRAAFAGVVDEALENPRRWRFLDGRWQADFFSDHYLSYRDLADPDDAKVVDWLQQPGVNWARHGFLDVPTDLRLTESVRFPRDDGGFAVPRATLDFRGIAERIDFASSRVVRGEVRMSGTLLCTADDAVCRVLPDLVLVEQAPVVVVDVDRAELLRRQMAMFRHAESPR